MCYVCAWFAGKADFGVQSQPVRFAGRDHGYWGLIEPGAQYQEVCFSPDNGIQNSSIPICNAHWRERKKIDRLSGSTWADHEIKFQQTEDGLLRLVMYADCPICDPHEWDEENNRYSSIYAK